MSESAEKIPRTGEGLRDMLFEQLERLRGGEANIVEAKTAAVLVNAIVKTVEVQLKYEQMLIKGDVSHHLSNTGILAGPEKIVSQGASGGGLAKGPATFAAPSLPGRRPKETA